jgi:hypothetical protein
VGGQRQQTEVVLAAGRVMVWGEAGFCGSAGHRGECLRLVAEASALPDMLPSVSVDAPCLQLASNARRLYGLNLCRGLGDKFLKDEDLGGCHHCMLQSAGCCLMVHIWVAACLCLLPRAISHFSTLYACQ